MIAWLFSCGGAADDIARYRKALEDGSCADIGDANLRDECWVARAASDPDVPCASVASPNRRGDCWFRHAEHMGDITLCQNAKPYLDDCRMHLLTASFATWAGKGTRPGADDGVAAEMFAKGGFAADDVRPWSAYYRQVLSSTRPLDRSACDAVPDEERRKTCRASGSFLYGDRLNYARDKHLFPCDGGPLPELLVTTPDSELDAMRAARTDLCP